MKPKKYQPKQSESVAQEHLIKWFYSQYRDKIIFAIPNDLKMAYKANNPFAFKAKMKKQGLLVGVSDLFIPAIKRRHGIVVYAGLFLELKAEGKTQSSLSKEQVIFIVKMREEGYQAEMAAGFDIGQAIIHEYMKGVT